MAQSSRNILGAGTNSPAGCGRVVSVPSQILPTVSATISAPIVISRSWSVPALSSGDISVFLTSIISPTSKALTNSQVNQSQIKLNSSCSKITSRIFSTATSLLLKTANFAFTMTKIRANLISPVPRKKRIPLNYLLTTTAKTAFVEFTVQVYLVTDLSSSWVVPR